MGHSIYDLIFRSWIHWCFSPNTHIFHNLSSPFLSPCASVRTLSLSLSLHTLWNQSPHFCWFILSYKKYSQPNSSAEHPHIVQMRYFELLVHILQTEHSLTSNCTHTRIINVLKKWLKISFVDFEEEKMKRAFDEFLEYLKESDKGKEYAEFLKSTWTSCVAQKVPFRLCEFVRTKDSTSIKIKKVTVVILFSGRIEERHCPRTKCTETSLSKTKSHSYTHRYWTHWTCSSVDYCRLQVIFFCSSLHLKTQKLFYCLWQLVFVFWI